MGKFLPVLLAIMGLGAGVGAGLALRHEPAATDSAADGSCPCDCATLTAALESAGIDPYAPAETDDSDSDFVKLNNQFVVPVVKGERIAAMVVLSISLEVPAGGAEPVYQREPRLRDKFLQVLFDHANSGGFDGAFTAGRNMESLRTGLLETARQELGASIKDVLITDIARQDI